MMDCLQLYKKEVYEELFSILEYWMQHTVDNLNGGFYGRVNNYNEADENAPKGSVMHARILWAFSAAYNFCSDEKYFATATRAFEYIRDHFIDREYGGVFWTVDTKGDPLDTKKQVYALAFCIYGLSEYYAVSQNKEVLEFALELYVSIEKYSYDAVNKGYLEAFKRDWHATDDLRL